MGRFACLLPLGFASLASVCGACGDLSEYRGNFSGNIIQGNFVRSCFTSGTRAQLRFDPERAVASEGGRPASFNQLTTTDGTFTATPLEPITPLPHDSLSEFDFPGPSRLRNFMLLARPASGPLAGRDALVVVSLLKNGKVELRIIGRTADTALPCPTEREARPEAQTDDSPAERPREYFGVFILK